MALRGSNIIKWITDRDNGFWAPHTSTAMSSLVNKREFRKQGEISGAISDHINSISNAIGWLAQPINIPELEQTYLEAVTGATGMTLVDVGIVDLISVLSSIPTVNNAPALAKYFDIPPIQAANRAAEDILYMGFEYGALAISKRYLNSVNQAVIPEPYRLALMANKGIIDDDTLHEFMNENGMSNDWADKYRDENVTPPSMERAFELWRRAIYSDDDVSHALKHNGMLDPDITAMMKLKNVVPNIESLIHMAERQVLASGDIDAQVTAMKVGALQVGVDNDLAQKLWDAHYTRLQVPQAIEAYYRGAITIDDVSKYLELNHVNPSDRATILNIINNIPSIRYIGFGYDAGLYNESDFESFMIKYGFSSSDAKNMGKAYEYTRRRTMNFEVLTQYVEEYAYGICDESTLRAACSTYGVRADMIDLWVQRAKLRKDILDRPSPIQEGKIISSTEAITAYKNGTKDDIWLTSTLKAVGWTDDRIALVIDDSKVVQSKNYTKTELSSFYQYAIINDDEYITQLQAIGYSSNLAEQELALEKAKLNKAPKEIPKNLSVTDIANMYKRGLIDSIESSIDLKALNYNDTQIAQIIALWDDENNKPSVIKQYTISDVSNLYINGILIDTDVLAEYKRMGYDNAHANNLLILATVSKNLPDYKSLYSNGWISEDDLCTAIQSWGLSIDRANTLMETIVKATQSLRTVAEKQLTKAEIIKGAKNSVLQYTDAESMLEDIGYSQSEADYILTINNIVANQDPQGYWDMKNAVEKLKKASGKPAKEVPQVLIDLEALYKVKSQSLATLKQQGASAETIAQAQKELNDVETEYRLQMQNYRS